MANKRRILIIGKNGPSAASFIEALPASEFDVFVADSDALSPVLHLQPSHRRRTLPAIGSLAYVDALTALCEKDTIEVVVPTCSDAMSLLAAHRETFEAQGIALLTSTVVAVESCRDRWILNQLMVRKGFSVPKTRVFRDLYDAYAVGAFPVVVKPRQRNSEESAHIIQNDEELATAPRGPDYIVQEYIAGEEYGVDVLLDDKSVPVAAVPRALLRMDSGVVTVAHTLHDEELQTLASDIASGLGLSFFGAVKIRKTADGKLKILDVKPDWACTLSLTVKSGVNMPLLALGHVFGASMPARVSFAVLSCVRLLKDCFVPLYDLGAQHADRDARAEHLTQSDLLGVARTLSSQRVAV